MDIIKEYKDYIESVGEGLIKTYPIEAVVNNLTNSLIGLGIFFSVGTVGDKIKLKFSFFNSISSEHFDSLFDLIGSVVINRGGWFPTEMEIINVYGTEIRLKYDLSNLRLNRRNYNIVNIFYESKFDEITEDVPDKLYHLSISEYKKKIIKHGLFPKSKNKLTSHLDRIYLCKTIEECKRLIDKMSLYYNIEKQFNVYDKEKRRYDKDTVPIIFEIDNTDHFIKKLYKDVNHENGYHILENVPPDRIVLI